MRVMLACFAWREDVMLNPTIRCRVHDVDSVDGEIHARDGFVVSVPKATVSNHLLQQL
jgi:hypothetical protein